MIVRVQCQLCKSSARCEVDPARLPPWLNPIALAMRVISKREGWCYRGGKIGRTVVDMVCINHRDPMYLVADVDPADATPGTHEEDLAIEVDIDLDVPTIGA